MRGSGVRLCVDSGTKGVRLCVGPGVRLCVDNFGRPLAYPRWGEGGPIMRNGERLRIAPSAVRSRAGRLASP